MYYKLAYPDASELKCQSKAPKFKPYQNCTTILPLPLSSFSLKGTQCFLSEEHIISQQNSIPSRKFIAKGVSLYANIDDFTCRKYNGNGVMIDYMLFLEDFLVAFIDFLLDYRLQNQIIGYEYMKFQENCTCA